MHTLTLAAPIAALALLPAVAGAHSRPRAVQPHRHGVSDSIVLGRSIGGIPLGITPSQLKRRLGAPSHTYRVSGKIAELDFDAIGIDAQFDTLHRGDPADFLAADKSRFHTARGIRPGSTSAAVQRAYRRDKLRRDDGLLVVFQGAPGSIGSRRTDFAIFAHKVQDIDIQTVFDDE